MTNDVCQSLQNILADRRKVQIEAPVDGYAGFLLIGKDGRPRVAMDIENIVRFARDTYKKRYPEHSLPHVSPHVFRHTFCTNMANARIDVKTLQYIMGHSNVGVTLNVYTHASFDHAAEQMFRIMDFKELDKQMSRKSLAEGRLGWSSSPNDVVHHSRLASTTPFHRELVQGYRDMRVPLRKCNSA